MYGIQGGDLMGAYNFSVGELTGQIKRMGKMNIAHLGNDYDQNTYIYYYMTMAMYRYVSLAYVMRTSDVLTVVGDGYVTFQRNGEPVEDLYEQVRILMPDINGEEAIKRMSFTGPTGWWRDSANGQLHMKGAGTYVMQYKGYPVKVSTPTQILEWPAAAYDLLIYETIGKIKESLNDSEGAAAAYGIADKLIPVLVKANSDAQGTAGGVPARQSDIQFYRR